MKIGLTYDVRADYLAAGFGEEETAEFDRVSTIDAIDGALRELGHETDRIGHVHALLRRLAAGDRWDLVFNIAEGLSGVSREAQVPAILDVYGIAYTFADPLTSTLTLHKAMTKRVLRDLGVPTPAFFVVETPADVAKVDLPFPLFVKPLAEGTAKGIDANSMVTDREALARTCGRVLTEFKQPALVERFLSGREFTVGIVGSGSAARAIGGMEVTFRPDAEPTYSMANKEGYETSVRYLPIAPDTLRSRVHDVALRAWRGLGCRDGGRVDIRLDGAGTPMFLEVNPLAGLNPVISDLPILCRMAGMEYPELIRRIVRSALERAPGLEVPPALAR
jgi:D-alanine-D-alanine ligase